MAEAEQIVASLAISEVPGEGGQRRKVLYYGDQLMVAITYLEPGIRWKVPQHPEEEVVIVVKGRLEYDDGRVLTDGMLTVNRPNQPHPGGSVGDQPSILVEIYAPPISALKPAAS